MVSINPVIVQKSPTAESWHRMQKRGEISFDRGFMGFEVIEKLIHELKGKRTKFGKVILGWRGDPLLHPEFERIFLFWLNNVKKGIFTAIRIETSPAFISEQKAKLASFPISQEWVIDLDQTMDGIDAGLERLEQYRFSKCHVILKRTARKGWMAKWDILRFPNFSTFLENIPLGTFVILFGSLGGMVIII